VPQDAPLPRERSLGPTRKGLVASIRAWLRKPVSRQKPNLAFQLRAMRDDMARLQQSLDRVLEQY
jgi:hypothetical protein